MKNGLFKKSMIIGIIILFVGASVTPILSGFDEQDVFLYTKDTKENNIVIIADDFIKISPESGRNGYDFMIEYIGDHCGTVNDRDAYAPDMQGVYRVLTNEVDISVQWDCNWYNVDGDADGIHWNWAHEQRYVDKGDLAVFRNHGCIRSGPNGLMFKCDSVDTCFRPGDAYDCYGDRDCEWIVLACCEAFAENEDRVGWAKTFDGAHLILGYQTGSRSVSYCKNWIYIATHTQPVDHAGRIGYSWFKACDQRMDDNYIAGILGENDAMIYDHLHGQGSVNSDPHDDREATYWNHVGDDIMNVPALKGSSSFPDKMTIYNVIPKNINTDYVEEIGSSLELAGEAYHGDDGIYYMSEGDRSLQVSEIEGIDYGDDSKLWIAYDEPPDLPSLEKAINISNNFLLDIGLMPDDENLLTHAIFSDKQFEINEETGEESEGFPTAIQVAYFRQLEEEYPVFGAGSRCFVYITEGDEVTGFIKTWRNIKPGESVDILPLSLALDLFENFGPEITLTGAPVFEDYNIIETTVGYFEDGYDQQQSYLIPVYRVDCEFINEEEVTLGHILLPASNFSIPLIARITEPEDDSTYEFGTPILFKGHGMFGTPPYTYKWSSNFDGELGNGNTLTVSDLTTHIRRGMDIPHTITLEVTDSNGDEAAAHVSVKITSDNDPPDTPTITGKPETGAGSEYEYEIVTVDPEGDDVYYFIDIFDGEEFDISNWQGSYTSGQKIKFKYTWLEKGDYSISVKCKDEYDAESDWATIEVSVPRTRLLPNSFLLRLFEQFPNTFPLLRILLQQLG